MIPGILSPVPTRGCHLRQPVGWPWLGMDWVVRSADTLPGLPRGIGAERRFLVLHPAHGVIILDLWRRAECPLGADAQPLPPNALEAEARLASFLRRLDPRLPVHRIHLMELELPRLSDVLDRAFAEAEPLALLGGDSWVGAVQAALAAPQPLALAARSPQQQRLVAGRHPPRASRAAIGIAATVVMIAIGVGLLAEWPRALTAAGDDFALAPVQPTQVPDGRPLESLAADGAAGTSPRLAMTDLAGQRANPLPEPPASGDFAEPIRVEQLAEPEPPQGAPLVVMLSEIVGVEPFPEPEESRVPPLVTVTAVGLDLHAFRETETPEAGPLASALIDPVRVDPFPGFVAPRLPPSAAATLAPVRVEPFPAPEAPQLPPLVAGAVIAARLESVAIPHTSSLVSIASMVARPARIEPFLEPDRALATPLVIEGAGEGAQSSLPPEPAPLPNSSPQRASDRTGLPPRERRSRSIVLPPTPPQAHPAMASDASSRCRAIVLHVQLGEELSHADRTFLRAGCAQRR